MKIELNIPDNVFQRALDGFSKNLNFPDPKVRDETKEDFLKRKLVDYLLRNILQAEQKDAAKIAIDAAEADVKDKIRIT